MESDRKLGMKQTLKAFGAKWTFDSADASQWKLQERPGGWWVATHAKTGERRRAAVWKRGSKLHLSLGGLLIAGDLVSESAARGGARSGAAWDAELTAQFPGKVRKVLVSQGQQVAEGDSLLLVEAMKMEFAIKAPGAAKVGKIHVKEGEQLTPGQKFLDLEASA